MNLTFTEAECILAMVICTLSVSDREVGLGMRRAIVEKRKHGLKNFL
jgi:hypothetical protein